MAQTRTIKISVKRFILVITLICIMVSSTVGYLAYAASSNYYQVITGGQYPGAPSFSVYSQDGVYYAKNAWGGISFASPDSTAVIEYCITQGGNIELAAGTYNVNINVTSDNFSLKGAGMGKTILSSSTSDPVIKIGNGSAVVLWNITISDLSIVNSAGNGLEAYYCVHNCVFENLAIINNGGDGAVFSNCWGAKVNNCEINGNNRGVFVQTGHSMTFFETYMEQNTLCNIEFNDTASARLLGCTIENSRYGVKIGWRCKSIQIQNCHFEVANIGVTQILINGTSDQPSRGCVVSGCFFEGHAKTYPANHIIADYTQNVVIQNNYFPVITPQMDSAITLTSNGYGAIIDGNAFGGNGTANAIVSGSSDDQIRGFGFYQLAKGTYASGDWVNTTLYGAPTNVIITSRALNNTAAWTDARVVDGVAQFRIRIYDVNGVQVTGPVTWEAFYTP